MDELPDKVRRALGAIRDEDWTPLQHRRIAMRLNERLEGRGRTRRAPVIGLAVAACLALAVAGIQRAKQVVPVTLPAPTSLRAPPKPSAPPADWTIGSDTEERKAVFLDGSAAQLTRGSRLIVVHDGVDETRLELAVGRAEFDVQKRPSRPFITLVRGVEIRVVGTHFSAELDASRTPSVVRVEVQRGVVEVRDPSKARSVRLGAGESLEVPDGPGAPAAREAARPPAAPPHVTAAVLFEAANAARGAGDVQGAIRSYAALLKQYPNDERAGVAALELGRLRMDSQQAFGPAAEAFRRAIAAAPNEGVREDAMARLVESLEAMRDREGCMKERQVYLDRYPRGVHTAGVESRCVRLP